MGTNSAIEWTHHTFNPWRGCTKVSEGCTHCYAETMSKRNPAVLGMWGPRGARAIAAESYWQQPLRWQREAVQSGERRRVFCASLADVFEGPETMPAESWPHVEAARRRLFELIGSTMHLDWLLLTKRPENILRFLPETWGGNVLLNMWLGTSVENQAQAEKRIPELLKVPATVRFLSCEPLLGDINLGLLGTLPGQLTGGAYRLAHQYIHWVIAGGESGPQARPMHPEWARSLRDQCQAAGVSFFFKQWGEYAPVHDLRCSEPGIAGRRWHTFDPDTSVCHVGKARAGRLLDGREWNEVPA